MSNKKTFELSGRRFKLEKQAYRLLEDYLDSLEEKFESHEDKMDIIEGIKERFADKLLKLNKETIDKDAVEKVAKEIGYYEDMKKNAPEFVLPKFPTWKKVLRILGYITFWAPHVLWILMFFFGSFAVLGVIFSGPETLTIAKVLTYTLALMIPLVGFVSGLYLNVKFKLRSMLKLLFAIEIPLFLLSIFRIFVFPYYSPALAFGYLLILFACFVMYVDLMGVRRVMDNKLYATWLRVVGYAVGFVMSFYIFCVWVFFAPMIGSGLIGIWGDFFGNMESPKISGPDGYGVFMLLPVFVYFNIIAWVFFLSPLYVFPIYLYEFVKTIKQLAGIDSLFRKNKKLTINKKFAVLSTIPVLTLFGIVGVVYGLSYDFYKNSWRYVDSTFSNEKNSNIKEDFLKVYESENWYRKAIVNRYLADFMYIDFKEGFNWNDIVTGGGFDDDGIYCVDSVDYRSPDFDYWGIYKDSDRGLCSSLKSVLRFLISPVLMNGDGQFHEVKASAEEKYKIVFDESIQKAEKQEINRIRANTFYDDSSVWGGRGNSAQTAGLIDEDKQSVHLSDLYVESDINAELGLHKTKYTLTFKNQEYTDQEVYLEFTLPENNVISDLKLGPDLLNKGQVAPKAAAEKVYDASVRGSIDPALIELIGPRTYRMRVFPIPPKNGTQRWVDGEEIQVPGFQKVQFEYSGATSTNYDLVEFDYTRNILIDDETSIQGEMKIEGSTSRVAWLEDEFDRWSFDIERKTDGNKLSWLVSPKSTELLKTGLTANLKISNARLSCTTEKYENIQKLRVFFDNSYSARSEDTQKYFEIMHALETKYPNASIDLYEFNFESRKVGENVSQEQFEEWLRNLKFWGYSDKNNIAKQLVYSSESPAVTVIVTDDSDFEINADQLFNFDYTQNKNNKVEIIQIGDRLTAQKEVINNLIWMNNGAAYLLPESGKIEIASQICSTEKLLEVEDWNGVISKIVGMKESSELIGLIDSSDSRRNAGVLSTEIAKRQFIINPFNSMIALETKWQQTMLDEESRQKDAFDQDMEMGDEVIWSPGMVSMPEANQYVLLVLALLVLLTSAGFRVRGLRIKIKLQDKS